MRLKLKMKKKKENQKLPKLTSAQLVMQLSNQRRPECMRRPGHPERMSKVNPFAWALIFTKSGFSGVFWDEK